MYVLSQASLQVLFITFFKLLYERWLFWEFSLHGVENQQPPPIGNLRTVTYKPFDPRQLDMKSDSSLLDWGTVLCSQEISDNVTTVEHKWLDGGAVFIEERKTPDIENMDLEEYQQSIAQ